MKQLFMPAILFMNRLKYGGKFVLVSSIFLIPLGILGFGYLTNVSASIDRTENELSALPTFKNIHHVYRNFQPFIIESIQAQKDFSDEQQRKLEKVRDVFMQSLERLKTSPGLHLHHEQFQKQLEKVTKALEHVESLNFNERSLNIEMYHSFMQANSEILQLHNVVANLSGVTNDPQLSTFYVGQYLTKDLYHSLKTIEKINALGIIGLSSTPIDAQLYDDLSIEFDRLQQVKQLLLAKQESFTQLPGSLKAIKQNLQQQIELTEAMLTFIDEAFFIAVDITTSVDEFRRQLSAFKQPFEDSVDISIASLEQLFNQRIAEERQELYSLLALVLGSLFIAGYLFVGMSLSIGMSVGTLVKTSRQFAEGDTHVRAKVKTNDEMDQLRQSFNWMIEKVGQLLSAIQNSSHQVSNKATQVEQIATKTDEAVKEQKATTEQVVAATHELLHSVSEISTNAQSVQLAVEDSNQQTAKSTEIVVKARQANDELNQEIVLSMATINRLATQSENISQVLDVIKAIAEQTNLLALNAAIEAARAGDQGRGFAVVADEVRTLARRTHDSTQEIEETISALQEGVREAVSAMQKSSAKTEETTKQSAQLDKALDLIKQAVGEIAEKNKATRNSSELQQRLANNMEQLIKQIQRVSDETEVHSKETISAGLEMTSLAEDMTRIVNEFYRKQTKE